MKIKITALSDDIQELSRIGARPDGGVCRLALTDEDRAARDWLVQRMYALGMQVRVDRIGNIAGIRPGEEEGSPVAIGSHLDTVATGGRYDGSLGVLAGLEVVRTLNEAQIRTQRPIAVINFTNEEGVRFAPDMMGSYLFAGGLPVENALPIEALDGSEVTVGGELDRIGYSGEHSCGRFPLAAYLELHIEQGPVLEKERFDIGAVEMVQGIYWTEYRFGGQANHAGTTPMAMRRDAGYAAARVAGLVREIVREAGSHQVGTVGLIELWPNLVNVVAGASRVVVDLRNREEEALKAAQSLLDHRIQCLADEEELTLIRKELVRFAPVPFDPAIVDRIVQASGRLGYSVKRMPSGAGHDAQMMAAICPAAMIFVPSKDGISHNPAEYTPEAALEKGANVLLEVVLELAGVKK